ncbi:hypothetical protein E0E62_03150 [Streptomyces sp. 16-176A]
MWHRPLTTPRADADTPAVPGPDHTRHTPPPAQHAPRSPGRPLPLPGTGRAASLDAPPRLPGAPVAQAGRPAAVRVCPARLDAQARHPAAPARTLPTRTRPGTPEAHHARPAARPAPGRRRHLPARLPRRARPAGGPATPARPAPNSHAPQPVPRS